MARRNGPIGLTGPTRRRANLCRRVITPLPPDPDRADPGGHRRGRPHRVVRFAGPPPAAKGPRSAGRPGSRPQGTAPEGAPAHRLRPRPLRHDHAEPRRQARRLRAAHPEAGLERDRDPARRRARSGCRGEAHRVDGEARAVRPRTGARPTVGVGDRHAGRDDEPVRPALARSGVGLAREAEPVRAVQVGEDDQHDRHRQEQEDDDHDDLAPDRRPAPPRCTAIRRRATRGSSTPTEARSRRAPRCFRYPRRPW